MADVTLYPTADGGKTIPALPGWGCLFSASNSKGALFYDGWLQLKDPLAPGEGRQRVGIIFLLPDVAVAALKNAARIYLWEGRFIGEAAVVPKTSVDVDK